MIISASRRTDIPAYYSEWFMNRIRAGYCCVQNPMNANQISRVSLLPSDVDVIVFWTKNARPLMPHLDELDAQEYRYYFQHTLTGYPRSLEPRTPPQAEVVSTFRDLSTRLGRDRVIWRYDPIVVSSATPIEYHREHFRGLARELGPYTFRVVISIVDDYRAARSRLVRLRERGIEVAPGDITDDLRAMLGDMADVARAEGMEIVTCAEDLDLAEFGISSGKCVDGDLIHRVFGITVSARKDKNQRPACGCVESRDIGAYDTCPNGCGYCYANRSGRVTSDRVREHDPMSPSLVGRHDCGLPRDSADRQLRLL